MLPAFNARNNSATKPSTTKRPTQKSRAAVFFIVFPKNLVAVFCVKDCALHDVHEPVNRIATQKRRGPARSSQLNISAVSRKSSPSTASEPYTTVFVVARETPSGVGWAS